MSRTAVLAVAVAVVLLGTAQAGTVRDATDPAPSVVMEDGFVVQRSPWLSAVQSGSIQRPPTLSSSLFVLFEHGAMGSDTGTIVGPEADPSVSWDLKPLGTPYTQVVLSPGSQVLAICEQTVQGWLPPCLLDGVAQVK